MNSKSTRIRMESSIDAETKRAQEGGLMEVVEMGDRSRNLNLEEMNTGKRSIRYNPYKKVMERIPIKTGRSTTQQRRRGVTVLKQEGDDIWYGNKMTQNHKNFRIFLQNPQGIDTSEKLGMFRLQLDEMRKYNINA